ncbi:MAG TPA: hypothetical protein VFU17_13750 [Candidatus Limnocylindrales bacterium]|nr:hypothetical protein [Candidatus Limnocylindrales bacterium]
MPSEAMLLFNCVAQLDTASVEEVWSWDGRAWWVLDGNGPPATVVAGVAWDPAGRTAVRYGGLPLDGNDCLPETWRWSITGWEQLDAEPPTACDHMLVVRDTAREVFLLFGGGDADGTLVAETWAWDGSAWRELAAEGPSGRAHFGFVYEAAHEQALLYGGYDGSAVFDDFWSWDGSAWTDLAFEGPGPRSHLGLAAGRDGLLLFGGASGPSTFGSLKGDTWFLTDGRWREVEGDGPSARGSPAIGYDEARHVFVLHGGFGPDGGLLGDTWEWADGWRCVSGC